MQIVKQHPGRLVFVRLKKERQFGHSQPNAIGIKFLKFRIENS
jgi:hypothetical protein